MVDRARLTDAIALAAQPREREFAIHDETLRGFMLRVQPGGSRSWALRFRRDGKPRRITLGQVGTMAAVQARAAALALLAREKAGGRSLPPPASGPTLARFATEYVERRSPSWKPSTHASTMSYLHRAILPSIGALRVDAVTRADVARWFYEYGRQRPGGANRAHDILRDMFARAIAWGHRSEAAGNPCAGITRYRRPPRGRLLGEDDLARLGAVLRRSSYDAPAKVAAVQLILLTGCRSGEVRRLRWRDVKRDRLVLHQSKTGPRQVPLGEAARNLLNRLSKTRSGNWVFPGTAREGHLSEGALYWFWCGVRDEAGIVADARLHDLRHSHASHAIMNGESLHMAGRLLGHRRAATTNRYAHLDDATLSEAAERVALAIALKLCTSHQWTASPCCTLNQQDTGV